MLNYIEYLNIPTKIGIVLVCIFFALQVTGELLELKGRMVPEFMKFRKYFERKKNERQTIEQVPELLKEVRIMLNEVKSHYNEDNIAKRDRWMANVDKKEKEYDSFILHIDEKMSKQNDNILLLLIENKRNIIIEFASRVTNSKNAVTREQFNQVFKVYEEYEDIIVANGLTNGEVTIAFRIITEAYEWNTKNHTFLEDVRGYGV